MESPLIWVSNSTFMVFQTMFLFFVFRFFFFFKKKKKKKKIFYFLNTRTYPTQSNDIDCGVFVCFYALVAIYDLPIADYLNTAKFRKYIWDSLKRGEIMIKDLEWKSFLGPLFII